MKKFITMVVSAFVASQLSSAEVELLSADDFARAPALNSISMSPEGDMLVGLIADPDDPYKSAAAYWDLPEAIEGDHVSPTSMIQSGDRSHFTSAKALKQKRSIWQTAQPYIGALGGCGEGKRIGSTKTYLSHAYIGTPYLTDIEEMPKGRAEVGANEQTLRCFELTGETRISSNLPLDPEHVIVSRRTTKNGTGLFLHNLKTGKERFLQRADALSGVAVSELDRRPLYESKTDFIDGEYVSFFRFPDANGDMVVKESLTTNVKERYNLFIQVQERMGEPPVFFVLTDKFSDKVAAYAYDPDTDTISQDPVIAHPDFNISGLLFSRRASDYGEIIGFGYQAGKIETFWIDPELKAIQEGLNARFPGKSVSLSGYTDDRNRVLVIVSAAHQPPAYFLLENKNRLISIGPSRPWIKEEQLGKAELIYYPARDGLQIPAILTTPPGYEPGMPTKGAIVIPHGGPWARDYIGFGANGWAQYFANRGYVILQPQYRGSTGWGRELWFAGDREWGLKMQDDKDDGAQWLVENGYATADRLAIHGYSYGGFAAIAASVRPDGPFQCAIAGAGVSNLAKISNTWGANRRNRIIQGRTVAGMDPMDNTDKIDIPILLYHGDYDVRVPDWHSRDFFNKIKSDSPDSELIILEEMGHQRTKWRPDNVADVLLNIERFLNTKCFATTRTADVPQNGESVSH